MTADASAHQDRDDLFVADFYPQLGEYLAEQHAAGYDAGTGRARFLAWLSEHAEAPSAADPVTTGQGVPEADRPGARAQRRARGRAGQADRGRAAGREEAGRGRPEPVHRSAHRSGVDRRGRHPGQESPAGGEPAAGGVAGQAVHRAGHAVPGPDPGGQPGPDPGGGEVRLHQGLQVLHVCHLVDPAGDHPGDGGPGADHPDPGAHGRGDQQAGPGAAPDAAGPGPRADPGRAGRRAGHDPGEGHRGAEVRPRAEAAAGPGGTYRRSRDGERSREPSTRRRHRCPTVRLNRQTSGTSA